MASRMVPKLENDGKTGGMTVILKSMRNRYPLVMIRGQKAYRKRRAKWLLSVHAGSRVIIDRSSANATTIYNQWREKKIIVTDPRDCLHFNIDNVQLMD